MTVRDAPRIRLNGVRFYVRNVRTRMPFRYGSATLTAVPILHAAVEIAAEDGNSARGISADCLPPKWFDKSPAHDFARNVADMLTAITGAARVYREESQRAARTAFDLWLACYPRILACGEENALNHLTAGFGSSLMERALLDALANLAGVSFFELLRRNVPGINAQAVHPELSPDAVQRALPAQPLAEIWVRHTVGLADPIRTAEIAPEDRLDDGLPQSLEECVRFYGLRYFKIKVTGDPDADWERLSRIAGALDEVPEAYQVSLDGNEQYRSAEGLSALLGWMREGGPEMRRLQEAVLYIEQPFERAVALDPEMETAVRALSREAPLIIDESDSDLDSFRRAVALGYEGTSVKNCKGVYKGLLNLAFAAHLNATRRPPRAYFLTVEDLMTVPVVPVQQDLGTAAALGVTHLERNGHHYVRGLAHLSPRERAQCLARHPGLYAPFEEGARLAVRNGRLDIRSLQVPGYALGIEVDTESMVPLEAWRFDSLGLP